MEMLLQQAPKPLLLLVVSGRWGMWAAFVQPNMHLGALLLNISHLNIYIWSILKRFLRLPYPWSHLKVSWSTKSPLRILKVLNDFFHDAAVFPTLSSKNQDDFGNFYRADYGSHRLTVCFRSIQPGVPVFHWRHWCGPWYLAKKRGDLGSF